MFITSRRVTEIWTMVSVETLSRGSIHGDHTKGNKDALLWALRKSHENALRSRCDYLYGLMTS